MIGNKLYGLLNHVFDYTIQMEEFGGKYERIAAVLQVSEGNMMLWAL